jgi:hypothetical protein
MEPDNKIYNYRITDREGVWNEFTVMVHKGKVIKCSVHPIGADWKSLKAYYEKSGAIIEETKDEPNSN